MALISVVIPLYNKENEVARSIESVLSQTYTDFEIIVVDDGSTDGSAEVVKSFEDTRLRLVSQLNAGVAAARNRGIVEARGEFVALLDADDEWKPEFQATQMALAEKYPECDVFAVGYEFVKPNGECQSTIIRRLPFGGDDGILSNYFEVASCSHPPICSISIMARKSAFEAVGGFPSGIRSGEDLLTWARLAARFKIAYSRKVCAVYNLGEGYDYAAAPPRRQDANDPVGKGLEALLKRNPTAAGLKRYLSHWHKMRASVALRFGERWDSLRECATALRFYPLNYKIVPFIAMALMPSALRKRIFALKKNV